MMQSSVVQDVGSLIDKMAAKLSVPAAHLWDVLVRQARAEAITDVVQAAVFLFALIVLVRAVKWALAKVRDENDDDPLPVLTLTFGTVGTVVLAILVVMCVSEAIQYFINPEYFAVKEVLNIFRPAK